jgi:hypothetical protein
VVQITSSIFCTPQINALGMANDIPSSFIFMCPKCEKSHVAISGMNGDDSNGECQGNQILPASSEVGHYRCEEKCHLILFSSLFRASACRNSPELPL